MAVDPSVIVAGIGAWSSLMVVAVKGALDARAAKAQTNGALQEPLQRMEEEQMRQGERLVRIEERTARTEERVARVERGLGGEGL